MAEAPLPDFLIVGAMKSGTTSLHHTLAAHPGIFLPEGEVHVFSVDDVDEHGPSFRDARGRWRDDDFDADPAHHLARYGREFAGAPEGTLLGVDASAYLSARDVPRRLARHLPDVKVVAVLRDPAERTWSAYWHTLRGGHARERFEDALLRDASLLRRSRYREHLARFHRHLDPDQIHVLCFEHLVVEPGREIERLLKFLDVDIPDVPMALRHANRAMHPRSAALQRARNRLLGPGDRWRGPGSDPHDTRSRGHRFASRVHRSVNRLRPGPPPEPMSPDTHAWLDGYLRRTNRGLEDMVDWDLDAVWYHSRSAAAS